MKQTKMGRETEDDEFTRVVPSVFKGPQVRSYLMFEGNYHIFSCN